MRSIKTILTTVLLGVFLTLGCDNITDINKIDDKNVIENSVTNFSNSTANIVVVTPDNLMDWAEVNVRGDGKSEITGAIPDQYGGAASLQQSSSDSQGKTDFRLLKSFGPVNELTELGFDWYRDGSSTAPAHLTPAVGVFVADAEGNSWLLKWEGTYNGYPTTGSGAPTNEWVTENLLEGNFWRIPQTIDGSWVGFGGCNFAFDPYGCFQFDRSLSDEWLDGFDVVGVEIGIGSGWNGTFLSYADYLTINDTIFDFELEVQAVDPQTIQDCQQGGWEDFGFKNQGQCIRFVNTGQGGG